jgi:GPI-anchor transamidase subunit K
MLSFSFRFLFIIFLSFIFSVKAEHDIHNANVYAEASESPHTNNWAVLVCASRYWFNYRVRIVGLYLCILHLKKIFG